MPFIETAMLPVGYSSAKFYHTFPILVYTNLSACQHDNLSVAQPWEVTFFVGKGQDDHDQIMLETRGSVKTGLISSSLTSSCIQSSIFITHDSRTSSNNKCGCSIEESLKSIHSFNSDLYSTYIIVSSIQNETFEPFFIMPFCRLSQH